MKRLLIVLMATMVAPCFAHFTSCPELAGSYQCLDEGSVDSYDLEVNFVLVDSLYMKILTPQANGSTLISTKNLDGVLRVISSSLENSVSIVNFCVPGAVISYSTNTPSLPVDPSNFFGKSSTRCKYSKSSPTTMLIECQTNNINVTGDEILSSSSTATTCQLQN